MVLNINLYDEYDINNPIYKYGIFKCRIPLRSLIGEVLFGVPIETILKLI
jgi:hypothetical protein